MARRMSQNATGEEVQELTDEQRVCIGRLLVGDSDEAAAAAAGVHRSTVTRWREQPLFVAELNAARKAAWNSHIDRLRTLIGKSLAVVEQTVDGSDERLKLQAALRVLAGASELWEAAKPKGPTTVQAVRDSTIFDLVGFGS